MERREGSLESLVAEQYKAQVYSAALRVYGGIMVEFAF